MGAWERIKRFFTGSSCTKLIKYDARKTELDAGFEIGETKFSLADFKTEVDKIREASDFSQLLDNYQFQMCRVCETLGRNDPEWRKYTEIRVGTLHILTSLEATLIAFKSDPITQKSKLYRVVDDLQRILLLVTRHVMPNIKDLESKDRISMGDIPKVDDITVSEALSIAGISKSETSRFIEQI